MTNRPEEDRTPQGVVLEERARLTAEQHAKEEAALAAWWALTPEERQRRVQMILLERSMLNDEERNPVSPLVVAHALKYLRAQTEDEGMITPEDLHTSLDGALDALAIVNPHDTDMDTWGDWLDAIYEAARADDRIRFDKYEGWAADEPEEPEATPDATPEVADEHNPVDPLAAPEPHDGSETYNPAN